MLRASILVLSAHDDEHVADVVPTLRNRGAAVVWFDPKQFPSQSWISLELDGRGYVRRHLFADGRTTALDEVTAIWFRRPNPVEAGPAVRDPKLREWVRETADDGWQGVLESLECFWVPARPAVSRAAHYKVTQLQTAAQIGFRVPRTCITNSPDAFLEFYEATDGRLIAKQVGNAPAWNGAGQPIPVYTTVVERRHALNADLVRHTPTIFQEYVPKRLELRITVAGDRLFPVAIDSQSNPATRHDWRHYDARATYRPHELPRDVEEKCLRLLRHYGLAFGAIDMVLTPAGEYVFLEINPNGQWAWIAQLTGLPIGDAVADVLLNGRAAKDVLRAPAL